MISTYEANETSNMVGHEKLDVRITTLDISLLDYVDGNLDRANENICRKITTLTKDLVTAGRGVEHDFSIPTINKRISITPISPVGGAACKYPEDFVTIARALDKAIKEVGVNSIDGYSIPVSKGITTAERNLILSIPRVLAETEYICSSINVGPAKTGLSMDAVELTGRIVREMAEATRDNDSLGCAKLVVFRNVPGNNPFMAGAFHGATEVDTIINTGVSDPEVVKVALERARGENLEALRETIKKTVFKTAHVGRLVAQEASRHVGIPFGIIDLSLTPTSSVGDSIAETLEEIGLECVRAPETTAALTMFNDQVKKGSVMAFSYMGGLSGVFIPVSKDQGTVDTVSLDVLILEKLEAMTCVHSVGPGMIAIPGDTSSTTIAGIIAGEAVIGMINQKTTAARLIPVTGKKVGDTAEFDGFLGYAPTIPINMLSCEKFVTRGEGISALIHSFKN